MSARSLHIKYIIVIVVLTTITVMSAVAMFNRTDRMFAAEDALSSVQSQLTSTLKDAAETRQDLVVTSTELTISKTEQETANEDLIATRSDLATTSADLIATATRLTTIEEDYAIASEQLAIETDRADSLSSEISNLQVNYDRMTTGYGYVLKDPTYQQMKSFIAVDRTDANEYIDDLYICGDFSADVKMNANTQKIRCAYVVIDYPDSGHAIIAFNTTDRGIIFIEPQSDDEVNLEVGKNFWRCIVPQPGYYYLAPDYNDKIVKYTNIW